MIGGKREEREHREERSIFDKRTLCEREILRFHRVIWLIDRKRIREFVNMRVEWKTKVVMVVVA